MVGIFIVAESDVFGVMYKAYKGVKYVGSTYKIGGSWKVMVENDIYQKPSYDEAIAKLNSL